jgi:hypothetical protein
MMRLKNILSFESSKDEIYYGYNPADYQLVLGDELFRSFTQHSAEITISKAPKPEMGFLEELLECHLQ